METNGHTEIVYWRSAKIPTVQYGARDICLTLKQVAEKGKEDEVYNELKSFVDQRVEAQANEVANDTSRLRIRTKDNKKYPSVTSILSPDPILIPNIEKYALRGTVVHQMVNSYLVNGQWPTMTDPPPDISPLKWTDIKYKEFFEKFGNRFPKETEDFGLNEEVFNEKHLYSGEIDYFGLYDGVPTIGDFKTGTWKLEQLVAYSKCLSSIKQLAIFDLKNCKVETWLIDEPPVQEAWENFLKLRGAFKQRFNI